MYVITAIIVICVVLVFNHIVLDDGQKIRVTAVNFLKDGQTWRLSTHRTLIKD